MAIPTQLPQQDTRIVDLEHTVFGHPKTGERGLLKRVVTLEELAEAMSDERSAFKSVGKGFLIGLSLNVIGLLTALYKLNQIIQELP